MASRTITSRTPPSPAAGSATAAARVADTGHVLGGRSEAGQREALIPTSPDTRTPVDGDEVAWQPSRSPPRRRNRVPGRGPYTSAGPRAYGVTLGAADEDG